MGKWCLHLFSVVFFIWSFVYLQVMRACIKSRTSSNFGQMGSLTTELAALEHLKISHRLIMGKWCLHTSSFIFDRIIIKVAGYQDRYKSSDESILGVWFPWPIYMFFLNEIWPWHIGLRWAIVALWATCFYLRWEKWKLRFIATSLQLFWQNMAERFVEWSSTKHIITDQTSQFGWLPWQPKC